MLVACGALMVAGCAPGISELQINTDHMLAAKDDARKQGIPVDVLWKLPDRAHTVVAFVEASGSISDPAVTWELVKLQLCRAARDVGADAVVIGTWQHENYSWSAGVIGYGGEVKYLHGTAIKYDDHQ
jgi:K+-transporting ATPase c subunit